MIYFALTMSLFNNVYIFRNWKRHWKQNLWISSSLRILWVNDELDMIRDYVETWCIVLWSYIFWWLFRKDSLYSRSTTFKKQERIVVAVKRLLYRYIFYFSYIYLYKFELLYKSIKWQHLNHCHCNNYTYSMIVDILSESWFRKMGLKGNSQAFWRMAWHIFEGLYIHLNSTTRIFYLRTLILS